MSSTPSRTSTTTPATEPQHTRADQPVVPAADVPVGAPATHATMVRRTVRSELIKLWTLRPNAWLLGVAIGFLLVLGPVQALGSVLGRSGEPPVTDSASAVSTALTGASTSTLLVGVLGVLLVAGEYGPRAIRTTFMTVPRRGVVVVAKALALALLVAVTAAVAVAIAVTASLALLSRDGSPVGWGSPDVLRVSVAMVWYVVGWGVLGLVAGWLTRSKVGGAALLMSVMLVLAPVLGLIPGRIGAVVVALMPSSAGAAMVSSHPATTDILGATVSVPVFGFVLWTVYLAALTAVSAVVVSHRDA
jgi:ABC-2 type transport system permease protein